MRASILRQFQFSRVGNETPFMSLGLNIDTISAYDGNCPFANVLLQLSQWTQKTGTSGFISNNRGSFVPVNGSDTFTAVLNYPNITELPSGTYSVVNPDSCMIGIGNAGGPNIVGYTNSQAFTFNYTAGQQLYFWCTGANGFTSNLGRAAICIPPPAGQSPDFYTARVAAGNPWNQDFLDFLTGLKLKTFRCMDLVNASLNIEDSWADRALPSQVSTVALDLSQFYVVPLEFIVDLANRTGINPWINVPARTTSTYWTNLAKLLMYGSDGVNPYSSVQSNPVYPPLDPALKAWFEFGNEIWNTQSDWISNTEWVTYLPHTRYTATANYATQLYHLAGHGLTNGEEIRTFCDKADNLSGVYKNLNYQEYNGGNCLVQTSGPDDFYMTSVDTGHATIPVKQGRAQALYVRTGEAGKSSVLDTNYANQCVALWAAMESVLPRDRVVRLLGTLGTVTSLATNRLAAAAAAGASPDYVNFAVYYPGTYWEIAGTVASDTSITPKVWTSAAYRAAIPTNNKISNNLSVTIGLYVSGSNPTIYEILNGTGAGYISSQTIQPTTQTGTAAFNSATTITGLTNGSSYELCAVLSDAIDMGPGANYKLQSSITCTRGLYPSNTLIVDDTYSNQALRMKLRIHFGIDKDSDNCALKYFTDAVISVCNPTPCVLYEGGQAIVLNLTYDPPSISSFITNYVESSESGNFVNYFCAFMAAHGLKLYNQFADVKANTFALASTYADVSDARYQAYAAFKGKVLKKPVTFNSVTISPSPLKTEPSYPHVIYTFSDSYLTYKLISGDDKGNYDIVGNTLRVVNGANINWSVPTIVKLVVEASNGYASEMAKITFFSGNSWYEPDALFVWDSKTGQSDLTQIVPTIGDTLIHTGADPIIVDDLWYMSGSRYAAVSTSHIDATQPWLVAFILDASTQTSTTVYVLGTQSATLRYYVPLSKNDFRASVILGASANQKFNLITLTGKHVYWTYYDADPVTPQLHTGYDQHEYIAAAFTAVAGSTLGRSVDIGQSGFQSQMGHGSGEIIGRIGMSLSDALSMVANIQDHHGIAL